MSSIDEILARSRTIPGISNSLPEATTLYESASSTWIWLLAGTSVLEIPFVLFLVYLLYVTRRLFGAYLRDSFEYCFSSRADLRMELVYRLRVGSEISETAIHLMGRGVVDSELYPIGREDGLVEILTEWSPFSLVAGRLGYFKIRLPNEAFFLPHQLTDLDWPLLNFLVHLPSCCSTNFIPYHFIINLDLLVLIPHFTWICLYYTEAKVSILLNQILTWKFIA